MPKILRNPLASELIYLLKDGPSGRRTLTEKVGASESSVRTVLEHLQSEGIVKMNRRGTSLSNMGRLAFGPLLESVIEVKTVNLPELSMGEISRAALLDKVDELSGQAWSFRDLAIREGARGAVILEINGKIAFLHSEESLEETNPDEDRKLKDAFPNWDNSSLIIVVSGDSSEVVEYGLWRIIGEIVLKKS
jgi:biotin operon repressor